MRNLRLILAGAGTLLLAATASQAAIDNSHHDAQRYVGAAAESKCTYCHGIPFTAPTAGETTNYGSVGAMCVSRCHTTTGLFGNNTEAVPRSAAGLNALTGAYRAPVQGATVLSSVAGNSHPVAGSRGNNTTPVTAPDQQATMQGTNWPYTSNTWLSVAGNGIQCTSCHAVHDNVRSPFLWTANNTQTTPASGGVASNFCQRCHDRRSDVTGNLGTLNLFGNHPVEIAWDPTTASTRGTGLNPSQHGRRGRALSMNTYGGTRVFDVAYNSVAGSNDFNNPNNHYVVGGHTGNFQANGVATNDMIGCYTCHSAHPGGNNNLLLGPTYANGAGATNTSPLCMGCHGTAGNRNNPGSSAWYHPVNNEAVATGNSGNTYYYNTSVGGFLVAANLPAGVPLGGASSNALVCSSCHDIHNGQGCGGTGVSTATGMMAIRVIPGSGQTTSNTAKICASCHTGLEQWGWNSGKTAPVTTQTGAQPNMHHLTYQTTVPSNGSYTEPSWATTFAVGMVTGSGVNGGANLDCADCHVFNGTAHNW